MVRFGTSAVALGIAAALAAVPAIAVPAAPATAQPTVTVQLVQLDVLVGPDGDTTCGVVADLYLPSSATPERPQPAVLTTHGFGGSKDDQAGIATALAERDYVVLAYSGLGFGGTQCKISLDHPDWDGRAASQLVDYLAGLDVVRSDAPGDPRVGMFGGSYGGAVQFAAAAVDDRIDALVPAITWHDLAYSLGPNNVDGALGGADDDPARIGVFKRFWADLFAVFGVLRGLEHAHGDPRRLVGCPNFANWVCPSLIEANLTGYASGATVGRMREASVATYIDRVHAPTLLLQGQADTLFNLQEAIATYQGLRAQGTPVAMIWHRWGHSDATPAPGEMDLSGERPLETTYLGRRVLDWYAYWLRDDHAVDLGPELAYFRDWIDYDGDLPEGAEPAYATADSYPVGGVREFHLSGDGTLTADAARVTAGRQGWANLPGGIPTSYSEIPPGGLPFDPSDLPGTYAAWTSAPLDAAIETAGVPALDVAFTSPVATVTQLSGPGGRLVVFAKLYDIAPDGTVTLVHRLISPVRVPDVGRPVRIELPGIVHRWEEGHRIQVVLAASDAAYGGNITVLPTTVRTTTDSAPVLHLPVIDPAG